MMSRERLPAIETYDLRYRTQTGETRFLSDTVMVLVATSGKDMSVDWGDVQRFIPDVLGYEAIGVATGRGKSGRAYYLTTQEDKPPCIIASGWQMSLPVITEPEAIVVVKAIA